MITLFVFTLADIKYFTILNERYLIYYKVIVMPERASAREMDKSMRPEFNQNWQSLPY